MTQGMTILPVNVSFRARFLIFNILAAIRGKRPIWTVLKINKYFVLRTWVLKRYLNVKIESKYLHIYYFETFTYLMIMSIESFLLFGFLGRIRNPFCTVKFVLLFTNSVWWGGCLRSSTGAWWFLTENYIRYWSVTSRDYQYLFTKQYV